MKLNANIVKNAWAIYRQKKEKGLVSKSNWRQILSDAYRQVFKYLKGCFNNLINFIKIDGTVTMRKVDLVSKYTQYNDYEKGRFFMWDIENKKVITLHPWQLI